MAGELVQDWGVALQCHDLAENSFFIWNGMSCL